MTKETQPKQQVMLTKDELRASIFGSDNMKCKRIPIKFMGQELELKQPMVEDIMKMHSLPEGHSRFAHIMISHVYVPGTDERIFDDADYDQLSSMPYSPQITEIQEEMNKFLISDIKEVEKN